MGSMESEWNFNLSSNTSTTTCTTTPTFSASIHHSTTIQCRCSGQQDDSRSSSSNDKEGAVMDYHCNRGSRGRSNGDRGVGDRRYRGKGCWVRSHRGVEMSGKRLQFKESSRLRPSTAALLFTIISCLLINHVSGLDLGKWDLIAL